MAEVSEIFQNHENNKEEVNRREIQAAIAKAVELRALHAALMQGTSPSHLRFPSSSPFSHFSAQDYPVFTPSYEDEPLAEYHQITSQSVNLPESWDDYVLQGGNVSDYKKDNPSSRKGLDSHFCPSDHKSIDASCPNHIPLLQESPSTDFYRSTRRNSLGDFKSISSCNRCNPAILSVESENDALRNNTKNSNIVVPLTDSHSSLHSQPKPRGGGGAGGGGRGVMSWLFPKLKKRQKNEKNSPNGTEFEEVSQVLQDFDRVVSMETLKRELIETNESRDAALTEVSEMRSSLGELKQKLEYLERYCEELKRSLRQTTQLKDTTHHETFSKSTEENNSMPVSKEVMVEGFLQVVSEARLSMKQFCKILVGQIDETDTTLTQNLNQLLQPYKLSLSSKNITKTMLYHLEAIINQSLYQDFENSAFQKNGSPKLLDPQQDRRAQFSSFVSLRNLSWNEVVRKGTKYYSEEFSKFCDQKMSLIITTLSWTRPWSEQLLQAFFVAAKCIWLLHLLAFSFDSPLGILRVEENRSFDSYYMEDMFFDKSHGGGPSRVKIMVMPGFYVQDTVIRCKVLCRYKNSTLR